ncbi:MAG TPA: hypothetical protein VEG60_33270 [Candidatus Binatia bacterium]|nr:hypothetical protein [Candidatus Binatia bacterium]
MLAKVKDASPGFFEKLVVELLVAMGMAGRAKMPVARLVGLGMAVLTV